MSTQTCPLMTARDRKAIKFFSRNLRPKIPLKSAGFSLIEIMVVLGIIGSMIAIGMNSLSKPKDNAKKVVRELALLGKEIRNHARLFNKTMRLTLEIKENGGSYWIEAANLQGSVFINAENQEKRRRGEKVNVDADGKEVQEFQKYPKLLKKPREMPKGLSFRQLETESMKEPLTEGTGYIYFFPDGHLEASALQVTDRKNLTWTVLFHPLTGEAEIIKKELSLRDYKK